MNEKIRKLAEALRNKEIVLLDERNQGIVRKVLYEINGVQVIEASSYVVTEFDEEFQSDLDWIKQSSQKQS